MSQGCLDAVPAAVFDCFRDGICVHQGGFIIYANASLAALLGLEGSAVLLGTSVVELFAERERQAMADKIARLAQDPDVPWEGETVGLRQDGTEIALEVRVSGYCAKGERCLLSVFRDITERQRTEIALRESEEKFARAFRSSSVLMAISRQEDGRLFEVNDAFMRVLGYTREELIGRTTIELGIFADPDQRSEAVRILYRDRLLHDFEIQVRTKDGQIRQGSFSADFVHIGGEPCLVTMMVDTTERKRAEEARRELEIRLQQSQRLESLGVLAGGVAHDFNNILVSILGYAELGLLELPQMSLAREHLAEIQRAASRAADLCRQMLAFSGRGRFVVEPVNLNNLVHEMVHLLEVSLSKKVAIKLDLGPDLPSVEADASQLRQVLMNLVINGAEAIGDAQGVVSILTRTRDHDCEDFAKEWADQSLLPGRYVTLEVTDTGVGMDEDTRARIFDPFFTTKFTGRGLGLAAVLGIVRGHHGAIKVRSEKGKGASFKVILPASTKQAAESKPQGIPVDWRARGVVLLVDDEAPVRDVGQKLLKKLGFEAYVASSGVEAVDLFRRRSQEVACVILDLTMPGMDGEETLRELRRIEPHVRVILSSGYSEQEIAQRFVGQDLAGFLQKPYDISTLAAKLAQIHRST